MIYSKIITFIFLLFYSVISKAQLNKVTGEYTGQLSIFKNNQRIDSVPVRLTIKNIHPDSVWQWKTEYLSIQMPVTKDYQLSVVDRSKGIYKTDEGDGIILYDYLLDKKMYCQFETGGFLLTSTYEFLNDDEILFEVTAGKRIPEKASDDLVNYQVNTLQRTVFKRKQ